MRPHALAEEGFAALASKPVLHGDKGSMLKAITVPAMLHWLGVKPSSSRPWANHDNALAKGLHSAKYRRELPAKGFEDLDAARPWEACFMRRHNCDHRHSGIRYVSPAQRHGGADRPILAGSSFAVRGSARA